MDLAVSQALTFESDSLARPRGLDDLATMNATRLLALYRGAEVPALAELEGDARGRMLAVSSAGRLWFGLLRAFAAWRHFPWRGKSFASRSLATRGDGINRVFGDTAPAALVSLRDVHWPFARRWRASVSARLRQP